MHLKAICQKYGKQDGLLNSTNNWDQVLKHQGPVSCEILLILFVIWF